MHHVHNQQGADAFEVIGILQAFDHLANARHMTGIKPMCCHLRATVGEQFQNYSAHSNLLSSRSWVFLGQGIDKSWRCADYPTVPFLFALLSRSRVSTSVFMVVLR